AFWPSEPAAKASGVPFMHMMEGRKGEKSRDLAVYDLEQRRLIDTKITSRTIDFMRAQRLRARGRMTPSQPRVPINIGENSLSATATRLMTAMSLMGQLRSPRAYPKSLPVASAQPQIPDDLCCISEIVRVVPFPDASTCSNQPTRMLQSRRTMG